jgi:threonylcarbamoyladenosine tRNA methylthiotransferase MtaB
MRYRVTTLGCRVNHAETRELESVLQAKGLVRACNGAPADLEIIHSCSVTGSAAAKSRQAIRRARRRQASLDCSQDLQEAVPAVEPSRTPPGTPAFSRSPEIIVSGCFGATNPEEAAQLAGGPDRVIQHESDDGTALAQRLARRVDQWLESRRSHPSLRTPVPESCRQRTRSLPVVTPRPSAGSHVRAELKIQEGCDAHCTFCIIPRIRRTLRSKTIPDAVREARQLVELGHREIVLTGIFMGAYGHETALRRRQDRSVGTPLADLLDAVAHVPGLARVRLSSMEPGDVSEALLDAIVANQPVVVPHLHLPLQSGSDPVLARMNRQYRVGEYLEMIDKVNSALTTRDGLGPAITTDIICGFPGETDEDFERTAEIASRVGYLHMHVFPYSARRGTAAARWKDRFVGAPVTKARVRRLIDLENAPADGLSIRFRRRLLGRTVRVIIEQSDPARPGAMTGRCDHYALLTVITDRPRGTLFEAEVTDVTAERTIARPLGARVPLPLFA